MKTINKYIGFLLIIFMVPAAAWSQARVQVIHNSADAAASVVDVWLEDMLLIDDFKFRTSTPFIDAPAGTDLTLYIKGSDSDESSPAVAQFPFFLEEDKTYIIVANGIVSPEGYTPAQPFDLHIYDMGREGAMNAENTDILVVHGSTDAPMVDVHEVALPAGLLIDDLDYSDFSGYLELPVNNYSIQVRDMNSSVVVSQYLAPLAELGTAGQALTVVASGFLNPGVNSDGPEFGLWVATAAGGNMIPLPTEPISTARAQIIHNSADAAAEVVDIWVNDALFVDNFEFRSATPFVDVPAGTELEIDILPGNSTSAENPVATFNVTFEGGQVYQIIASGLINPDGYSPFRPFNLYVYNMAREASMMMSNTDVLVFHGSTDAPTVDVFESSVVNTTIVDDLEYASFAGYLELPQADYSLQVRNAAGTDVVAQFAAPIAQLGLAGQALSIIASGFLNPAVNSNGPAFGLYVALPAGGKLIALPQEAINTARVQVIHNSSDPAAEQVDIWLNGQLFLDDFGFRTATPFVDAPAGTELRIAVQPANSTSADNPIAAFDFTLEGGQKYVLIASGEVTAENQGMEAFNIYVYPMAREAAMSTEMSDVNIFHGSTDAPAVDLFEVQEGIGQVWDDLAYGDFTGYVSLPVEDYSIQVRNSAGTDVVAQYALPIEAFDLGGLAATIVASGYLSPATSSLPTFGLWAALPSGGQLIPLPQESISTARVQVIHNSADLAAEMVDVWLNGQLLIDDFKFRTATPFIDAPANEDITIAIQPANSSSAENALAEFTYNLMGGEKYIIVANGIVSPEGYNPVQPFNLYVYPGAREAAMGESQTDVAVFHGSTDAPTVDVYEVGAGAGLIVDDLMYGQWAGYLELPTDYYSLQIRDQVGESSLATYNAPLASLDLYGSAITIVASGFLNPAANNNGASFGLWVALPAGGALIELPSILTNVEEDPVIETSLRAYPNPARETLTISYEMTGDNDVVIELFDLLGNKVKFEGLGTLANGFNQRIIDVSGLPSGMYILRVSTGTQQVTEKVKIIR